MNDGSTFICLNHIFVNYKLFFLSVFFYYDEHSTLRKSANRNFICTSEKITWFWRNGFSYELTLRFTTKISREAKTKSTSHDM